MNRERAADEWVETFSTTMAGLFPDESLKFACKPKIAILDTGIDPSHPFIAALWSKKRHSAGEERYFDFLSETESKTMQDDFGHGTHVAGIFLQLVPFADLYVARVFRNDKIDEKSTVRVANVCDIHIYGCWRR
jgi:Subtilase family